MLSEDYLLALSISHQDWSIICEDINSGFSTSIRVHSQCLDFVLVHLAFRGLVIVVDQNGTGFVLIQAVIFGDH